MKLEEYAKKNGWVLKLWSGESSQDLQVWFKDFGDGIQAEVGHDKFTAVIFHVDGERSVARSRRRRHGVFTPTVATLTRVDELNGKSWHQPQQA